jgi:hypothetical protein
MAQLQQIQASTDRLDKSIIPSTARPKCRREMRAYVQRILFREWMDYCWGQDIIYFSLYHNPQPFPSRNSWACISLFTSSFSSRTPVFWYSILSSAFRDVPSAVFLTTWKYYTQCSIFYYSSYIKVRQIATRLILRYRTDSPREKGVLQESRYLMGCSIVWHVQIRKSLWQAVSCCLAVRKCFAFKRFRSPAYVNSCLFFQQIWLLFFTLPIIFTFPSKWTRSSDRDQCLLTDQPKRNLFLPYTW